MNISMEAYDRLVSACLDAVFEPRKWQQFCETLDLVTDGAYVAMHAHDIRLNKNAGYYMTRHPEEFARSYQEHYDALNPILPGLLHSRIGVPVETEEIVSYSELFRTEYYNDWMRPQENTCAGCGIVLFRSEDRLVTLGCQIRLVDAEAKVGAVKELLALLAPHLQRAFNLQRALEGQSLAGQLGWQGLDALPSAVMFLDRLGRPLFLNSRARDLLEQRLVLRLGIGGGVVLVEAGANDFLQSCLSAICVGELGFGLEGRQLHLGPGEPPALLRVIPVPRETDPSSSGPFAVAEPPLAMLTLTAERVSQAVALAPFGLTPAETALALSLAGGKTLGRYSEERGLSIHTVRNQLRAIFLKTSTSRQSELVALLTRLL